MKISKKEIFLFVTGLVLTMLCIFLSRIDCMEYCIYNGWTSETTSISMKFMPDIYLYFGIAEIFLLLCRRRIFHIMAVIVSFMKVVFPWIKIGLSNYIGSLMSDASTEYIICNPIPYVITIFATLLFLLISVSVIRKNNKGDNEEWKF